MNKFLFSVILILSIYACKNEGYQSSELVRIDFLYNETSIDYSECDTIKIPLPLNTASKFFLDSVCSNYSFIVLETSKASLIGEINKVIFTDSLIFIGDFEIQKSIFVFNHEGRFIRKICRHGQGPGEYRFRISNFFINDSLKTITITDNDRSQVIETDYNGSLLYTTSPQLFGNDIIKLPDDSLLYFYVGGRKNIKLNEQQQNIDYEYNLLVFNNKYEVVNSYFPINSDFGLNYGVFNNFEPHNNKLYFKPRIDNRIFEIGVNHLKCRYYIDFGNLVGDTSYMVPRNEVRGFLRTKTEFPEVTHFIVDDGFWFFWGHYNKKCIQILYSSKSNKVYHGFDPVFRTFGGRIIGMHNQHIVMTLNASELEIYKPLKERLGKQEQHIIETVGFYDNPILVLGKLKDF
jgi:hypothetical protein